MSEFQKYIDLGWKLCKIEPGTKGPRTPGWNAPENALKSAEGILGAGLLHALSGTCAIDIDDWAKSEAFLAGYGINLNSLYAASDAVTVSSGTEGRGKLLYRLPEPLTTIKVADNKLEFRCASRDGTSVQDVLPPSVHPTGRKYVMNGDPSKLPMIPKALQIIWMEHLQETPVVEEAKTGNTQKAKTPLALLKKLVMQQDHSGHHDDWNAIGMIIHYETDGSPEGFALFDEWSAQSNKYPGVNFLQTKWNSYGQGTGRPLTAEGLKHQQVSDVSDFDVISPTELSDFMEEGKEANPYIGKFLRRAQWGDLPQTEWLLDGVIPARGLGCLWAPSGAGKSFMGIDLAVAVASGGMWRGQRLKQGTVLVVAAEDGTGYRERVEAAYDAQGVYDAPVHVLDDSPKLYEKKHLDWMVQAIQAEGKKVSMIIVDTMAAATAGMDENSTKDVTKFIADIRKLQRAFDCFVLLIHHTGKDASRGSRGSSAFHGTFDVELELELDGLERTLWLYKLRNASNVNEYGVKLSFHFGLARASRTCAVEWH